ncbi:MAG: DUF370 domain-containing protein [Lachnospiraceae bacterium]|nr:DUF370 domain-containing protein [Lachnospiraceae bacterium]MCI1327490.1 DUF370 domain-containing protein [Lachnospiraceae bacterium]
MSLLINIGFGNCVNEDKVLAVVNPLGAPVKRLVAASRDEGLLIDASQGRKTKAVIIMTDGRVVLSALQPETIMKRFNSFGTDEEAEGK